MGVHKKDAGIRVISFFEKLGQVLGYYPRKEEDMFPGIKTSSILDLTWRRNENEKFPLFIFEVESLPQKAAPDNAMKVFGWEAETYPKPLFFFHIFVNQTFETDRITYLRKQYDKYNYRVYRLTNEDDQSRLISDILSQHFLTEPTLNLYSLIDLLETQSVFKVTSFQVLTYLIERGYDQLENSNFLMELERLIAKKNYQPIRQFYISYLRTILSYTNPSLQVPRNHECEDFWGYSPFAEVIHPALLLLVTKEPDYPSIFKEIMSIEEQWEFWEHWKLCLGLSNEHDMAALADYPLLLTLLCAAFALTQQALYFSSKLRDVVVEAQVSIRFYAHGLIWLLIAAQIAHDQDSYEFARSTINSTGGIPIDIIIKPPHYPEGAIELIDKSENRDIVPEFKAWKEWLQDRIPNIEIDILTTIIKAFLVCPSKDWDRWVSLFAIFCLQRSLSLG